jgi:GT2 family glycosyltransferase
MLRLGVVILTHDSDEDLPLCLAGLLQQQAVHLDIIVVDNASQTDRRERMCHAFREAMPKAHGIDAGLAVPARYRQGDGIFVSSRSNGGYSAGNNIGARIATALGCTAILIVNPDVRITMPDYLLLLAEALLRDDRNAIAASAIRNLAGANENPMFEPSFRQELFAPLSMITRRLFPRQRQPLSGTGREMMKLSGCCFLIRSEFLIDIGYFDESVFLYCEEAILAAQIRRAGGQSVYVGDIEALHAHRVSAKGDPVRRQRLWSRSRRYLHKRYIGYGLMQRSALSVSHGLVIALTWAQQRAFGGAR